MVIIFSKEKVDTTQKITKILDLQKPKPSFKASINNFFKKMSKIKNFFASSEHKFFTAVVAMLFIIICLQVKIVCSFNSLYRPGYFKELDKLRKDSISKRRKAFENFDKEIEEIRKNREKMILEINKVLKEEEKNLNSVAKNGDNTSVKRKFIFRPQLKETENNYVIILKTPKEVKKENIKTEFKNKNLTIIIEKEEKGESYYNFDSFAKTFYLEKASEKPADLKIIFDKSELNITIKKI